MCIRGQVSQIKLQHIIINVIGCTGGQTSNNILLIKQAIAIWRNSDLHLNGSKVILITQIDVCNTMIITSGSSPVNFSINQL